MDTTEAIRWLVDRVAALEGRLAAAEARLSMVEMRQKMRPLEPIAPPLFARPIPPMAVRPKESSPG